MKTHLLGAALLLTACGGGQPSGELTADESRQLNEAAAMLDANSEDIAVSEDAAANSGAVMVVDQSANAAQ
jgi:hypothetical protein